MSAIDVDKNWKLLINGEWVDPAAGTYDVIDPATTKVVGRAPERAFSRPRTLQRQPKRHPSPGRTRRRRACAAIGRLADEVAKRSADWVPTVQAETGALKKITETLQVGGPAVDRFRYYSNPSISTKASLPSLSPRGRWARPDSCRPG